MDTSTLKVFAITYIKEQDNIQQNAKCELMNFVKESEGDEILHLIFNGNIPKYELNDAERFVLRAQAENFIYPLVDPLVESMLMEVKGKTSQNKKKKAASGLGNTPKVKPAQTKKKAAAKKAVPKKLQGLQNPKKAAPKKASVKKVIPKKKTVKKAKDTVVAGGKVGVGDSGVLKSKGAAKELVDKGRGKVDDAAAWSMRAASDVKQRATKAAIVAKPYIKKAGYAAIVAAITAASYAVYKRYMTAGSRACSGRSGMERRDCLRAYRKKALQARITALQQQRTRCDSSRNPVKCKSQIDMEIKKVRYKISTLHSKY